MWGEYIGHREFLGKKNALYNMQVGHLSLYIGQDPQNVQYKEWMLM